MVDSTQAAAALGMGRTKMWAIKKAMGIAGRHFFLSDVVHWLRTHREFVMPRGPARSCSPRDPRFAGVGRCDARS